MDFTKELLLTGATALMSVGVVQVANVWWQGLILILASAALFVGRGFYKKYIEK